MIFLNPESFKIKSAKHQHLKEMLDLLFIRIDKIDNDCVKSWFDFFVNDYLEVLISGDINAAYELSARLNSEVSGSSFLLKYVKQVFNYDWFIYKTKTRYSGYDLAKNLDATTCTYCNRNYTVTVASKNGNKITRPQFDHYLDKSRHPFLALSFYNLIPSCSICNSSVKHGLEFSLNKHAHPYLDESINNFRFSYEYSNDPYHKNGLKIKTEVHQDWYVKNLLTDLKIDEIYNAHTDILFELLKIKQSYSDKYLSILEKEVLNGLKVSRSEVYRLAFGVFYDEPDFDKRPFSKFKKDILKELNIIT
ncbi:hypothetical protein [Kriegella aquimaris]|uniref:HNH endonuclease n=1 Tax=Kriegella aquimaris TaxID=192904 RepID=A0A1G9LDA0_9FLAO|nr:hypothetical protein [Kriegella aquimaris]SDL59844.1 hypothetical protein SAMN04488514_10215 [Kriegella aquimaris]